MAGQIDRFINIFVETKNSDKKLDDVITKVDKLSDANKKNTKSLSENGGAMGLLGAATGGLSNDFKDAIEVAEGFGISLKGLRGAIIATGIGALAIVLLELITNWEKWSGVIDGSTAAMEDLNAQIEKYEKFQEQISLNFSEELINQQENIRLRAAQGASVKELTKLEDEFSKTQENLANLALYGTETTRGLFDIRADIAKQLNSLNEGSSKYNEILKLQVENEKKINEQVAIKNKAKNDPEVRKAEQETLERTKKQEAADRASAKAAADLLAARKALAALEVKLANDIANINAKTEEDRLNILQAGEQKQLDAIQLSNSKKIKAQELLNEKYRLLNIKNSEERLREATEFLRKQEETIAELTDKSGMTALENKQKQELLDLENTRLNEEEKQKAVLNIIEKYRILRKELNDKNQKEENENNQAIRDQDLADEQAVAEAKLGIINSYLDSVSGGIGILKSVFERNRGLQKALLIAESAAGIAKIIINTQAANAAAVLKYAPLPGGKALAAAEAVANKVSAGIGIAANIAATTKALAALGGGSANSNQSNPSATGGGEGAQAQFNIVGTSGTNQLAATIGAQQQQPINAYVVGSDVSTQQALDRNRITNATFL